MICQHFDIFLFSFRRRSKTSPPRKKIPAFSSDQYSTAYGPCSFLLTEPFQLESRAEGRRCGLRVFH